MNLKVSIGQSVFEIDNFRAGFITGLGFAIAIAALIYAHFIRG